MSKKPERSQGIHPATSALTNAIIPEQVRGSNRSFFGFVET